MGGQQQKTLVNQIIILNHHKYETLGYFQREKVRLAGANNKHNIERI